MMDPIEKFLQIQIHHPAPAVGYLLPGLAQRLMGAATWSKSVAVSRKIRVKQGVQYLMQRLLDQAIHYRGNAKLSYPPASGFGYLHPAYRLRLIAPFQQLFLDSLPMGLQIGL